MSGSVFCAQFHIATVCLFTIYTVMSVQRTVAMLKKEATDLGLLNNDVVVYVKEQQAMERDEREKQRQFDKAKLE